MKSRRWVLTLVRRFLLVILLAGFTSVSSAFVVIGLINPGEINPDPGTGPIVNNVGSTAAPADVFGLGGPKDIKAFFRWNTPHLVYSFDASFINYFGFEGMEAVHDAFQVLNDFFVPEDGSYGGVSELNLVKHGFAGNFNTAWVNTTAQNAQIIDIKSLTLGMLVNELGLGNPHRHAFSITGATTNLLSANMINFQVRLRNYDPYSLKETDLINGVQYAYRLIHDGNLQGTGALPTITVADMEEYTADTSGNAWSSVAGIMDGFYGETLIYWSDQPTLFNYGVYYDGMNAMGGQYQPRHALTFDDAGGLKYLYSTNNYAYESLGWVDAAGNTDPSYKLLYPAQLLPTTQDEMRAINSNWSGVPAGLNFQNGTGTTLPVWPRAGGIIPTFRYTTPIFNQPVIGSTPGNSWTGGVNNRGPQDVLLRGGIDKMQFYYQPFDSLFGVNPIPTNFVWNSTFVHENGYQITGLNNTAPGASAWQGQQLYKFATMTVGRTVTEPDFIFVCDELGLSNDGVPIAYQRTKPTTTTWVTNIFIGGFIQNLNTYTNEIGPGVMNPEPAGLQKRYTFTRLKQDFELIWSGENTVTGNQDSYYSLWGHIKGPGPNDLVIFPRDATMWRVQNALIPDASVPVIDMISDSGGVAPIEQNTYTRTEETLSVIGTEMASVTAIEIMRGELVIQTIMPVDKFIQSNTQIDIPPGLLNEAAEGAGLELRVWNSVGASQKAPQKFAIETGRPVITSTTVDGIVYDRAETLTVHGYGFKSSKAGEMNLAYFRLDDSQGAAVYDNASATGNISDGIPVAINFQVMDDNTAIMPPNAVTASADGSARRMRVARFQPAAHNLTTHLSPPSNPLIAAITSKPVITALAQNNATGHWEKIADTTGSPTGMYKRDYMLEINGTGLNTLEIIEIVQQDGTSFANPVFIQLPNAAVTVEDNGTRVHVGANAIPYPDADTNATVRSFRLYNSVGINDINSSLLFVVNVQPQVTGLGGFGNLGYFNRDKTTGDDVAIYGSGLKAVSEIHIVDINGSDMDSNWVPKVILPHPAVTVTDTQIHIDTQVGQFSNGTIADTDVNTTSRIFKLVSARDDVTTQLADRFGVGVPPGELSIGGFASANNYNRYADTMEISGTGLGMVTQVEIVDIYGNQIPGVNGLIPSTGLNVNNGTALNIDPNATGWLTITHLLDSAGNGTRRVRITTPFGTSTSNGSSGGAFTVSAPPVFLTPVSSTFANGGFDAGTTTYTKGNGDLFIHGLNFRGVKSLTFRQGAVLGDNKTIQINADNPPANISFNAAGTEIRISSSYGFPAEWLPQNNAALLLNSVADKNATTGTITTAN